MSDPALPSSLAAEVRDLKRRLAALEARRSPGLIQARADISDLQVVEQGNLSLSITGGGTWAWSDKWGFYHPQSGRLDFGGQIDCSSPTGMSTGFMVLHLHFGDLSGFTVPDVSIVGHWAGHAEDASTGGGGRHPLSGQITLGATNRLDLRGGTTNGAWNSTRPFTWVAGDSIRFGGSAYVGAGL